MTTTVAVERLLERFGIEVVERAGQELWARCPAHRDTKPSWSINVRTAQHHCFSCDWGGGAPALVIRGLGVDDLAWDSKDAWEWLETHGFLVEVDPALSVELVLSGGRPHRFVLPREVRVVPPAQWPSAARAYMQARGVTPEQVVRWGLGFAVDGRLAGRVVFPLRDSAGALRSYTARTFLDDPKRYLTPTRAEGPDSSALFGEEHWPGLSGRQQVVVVEGALDALAVERAIGGAVAGMLGATRASAMLVAGKLATFDEVVVATDPDPAGDAAWEALYPALVRHCLVRRVRLPEGEDAASLPCDALAHALSVDRHRQRVPA